MTPSLILTFMFLGVDVTSVPKAEAPPKAVERVVQKSDLTGFYNQLEAEIKKQQDLVKAIQDQAKRTDIILPGTIVTEYENALTMLNIKRTLYGNFVNTPAVESPEVRNALLAIFKKTIITPGDLSQLDALVQQERPKYVQ